MSTQEIDKEIKAILSPGEEVLLTASQARGVPGGSISSPNKIYITNMRVLFKDPRLFGLKANIVDVSYKDISNVRLKRGVFSTEIILKSRFLSDEVNLPAVDKQVAQQVMGLIQKGVRGELPRQVTAEGQNAPSIEAKSPPDPIRELEKIGDLKQKGIITEEEFQMLKADLLKKIRNI
jgi:PH (Pleckstrin Homology) domain-containing protein/putative oligomerization/nucleic acid binding protein